MAKPLIATLADLPFHVSGKFPKPVLIRHCKPDGFEELSSRDFFERVRDCALGLQALGVGRGDRVGLICETRPEWLIADLGVLTLGALTVPIYPTLPPRLVQYILSNASARTVIVSNDDQAAKVREVRPGLPDLRDVIVIDQAESAAVRGVTEHSAGAEIGFADVIQRGHHRLMREDGLGRAYKETVSTIGSDDVATLIYTSGTTGDPKGVVLTHGAIVANLVGADALVSPQDTDEALSFLPLCHALERTAVYMYLYKGVTVTFAESLDTVSRDLARVRPTMMTGVPRVFDKIHARVLAAAEQAPAYRRALFNWALGVGMVRSRAELEGRAPTLWTRLQNGLADRLLFSKIRERVGGRLRFVVSGGAPLSRTVAEFLFAVGIPVLEGYGLTETAPVLTINPEHAPRLGTVGKALPGVELRIAEDGEILARGPNLMLGYYNNPEATSDVMTDGWFHTGDIGRLDDDGYLTITDRKKELLVTAGGKNVAPQPIELRLKTDPLVAEAIVVGDGRPYVAVLIVPDVQALAGRVGIGSDSDLSTLVLRNDVRTLFDSVVQRVNAELPRHEQLKRFALLPAEFSVATGELTPTLKVKRRVVADRWNTEIEGLYAEASVLGGSGH